MIAKRLNMKSTFGSLLLLPGFFMADQAMAQEAAASGALEEILVTAQKREESLQDAAVSVTALQGENIRSFNITDPDDLQTQMPAVQFMTSGLTNTTIRGVGTYNNQPNMDAAVAWNIDGTYISHHMATPPILYDLERVEVVRGPLGTLYGRNSNGGAINVLTAKPVLEEWHARASVGYGNHDQFDTELMLNVPINEDMAFRVAFANDYADGYMEDGNEGTDNYSARARLLIEPSENFNLIGTVEWSDVDGSGVGLSFCPPFARQQRPVCQPVEWKPYQGFGLPGQYNQTGTQSPIGINPGWTARENLSAYVEWNYNFSEMTLTSLTNYHYYDREELHVWDFNSYSPIHENSFFTQEFRLASTGGSALQWVGGFFASREESDGTERFGTQTVAPAYNVFQAISSYGVENGLVTSMALFADLTYSVTDVFRLKGGLRYTDEKKELPGTARQRLNTPNPVIVVTGDTLKTDKFTWLVGFEWDVGAENMVYAKINTGFKSGTVNAVPEYIGFPTTTTPEEITAYQVGSKNRFLDGRMQLNAEFFFYDYEGYQTVVNATDPTGFFPGVFFPTVNAQKAEFLGGEIESSFAVGENGQFDLALTLLDAEHVEFITPAANWSGNDVQRAPPWTVIAAYGHDFPLESGALISGRISSQYVDEHYTRDSNLPGDLQESYTNTSAFLEYRFADSRWSVSGWIRNIEDEDVMGVSMGTVARNGWNVFMLQPRMYGFTVRYEM